MKNNEIVEIRARNDLTQEGLAKVLGVTMQQVSRWERGEVKPGPRNRHRLEKLLRGELETAAQVASGTYVPPKAPAPAPLDADSLKDQVIALQKEKIERLEDALSRLRGEIP